MKQDRNAFGSETQRYLDGEIPADAVEASARTEADRLLNAVTRFSDEFDLPGQEVDRAVMAAIRERGNVERESFWSWLLKPHTFQMRPALAVAAMVVLVLAGVFGGSLTRGTSSATDRQTTSTTVLVRFELVAPRAEQVSLAGSFNEWQPDGIQLTRNPDTGVWTGTVPLVPGEHQYMFVIDGIEWIPDPDAHAQVDDGFGQANSVIVVGPRGVIRS